MTGKDGDLMKRILIVDDNDHLALHMEKKLQDAGHEVVTVFNGMSAIKALADYAPDIVFCDYFLPNLNGDKLCQIIRRMEHLKDTYLVIMSAAASELNLDPSSIGADALIAKGSFQETEKHSFAAIEEAQTRRTGKQGQEIMGMDTVFPRRMTKELLEKKRHLQTILDSISEGIVEVYCGRIVYANPTTLKILRKTQDQLLAIPFPTLFEGQARLQVESLISSGPDNIGTIDKIVPKQSEDRILSMKRLPFQGDSDTIILLITDITERKHMEDGLLSLNRELQETNKTLQAAYQWMRDSKDLLRKSRYEECFGFFVDCEGKIEWISEKVLEYTGKSRNELIACNIEDLFQPSCRDHFRHALKQAWIGIFDPIKVEIIVARAEEKMFEAKITRLTSSEQRRVWVSLMPTPNPGEGIDI